MKHANLHSMDTTLNVPVDWHSNLTNGHMIWVVTERTRCYGWNWFPPQGGCLIGATAPSDTVTIWNTTGLKRICPQNWMYSSLAHATPPLQWHDLSGGGHNTKLHSNIILIHLHDNRINFICYWRQCDIDSVVVEDTSILLSGWFQTKTL